MKKRKINYKGYVIRLFFVLALLFAVLNVKAFAEEKQDIYGIPKEYSSLVGELDETFSDMLPDGIGSDDIDEVSKAVSEMTSAEYLLSLLRYSLGLGIESAGSLFATLCGIIVLSAVFSAFGNSFVDEGVSRAVAICSSAALLGFVIAAQVEHFSDVGDFFDRISLIMSGMIPTISVIYAMGGNITTATASSSTLYIFLAFCEEICRVSVLPVAGLCTAFSLCSSLSSEVKFGGLSSAIKKCYTFLLALIMTVLLAVLSSQTLLSVSADTVSARAAKLLASNVIPIVGSSVGDTFRTLSSAVGYIKNVCGIGGIIFILLLVLPIIIRLLLIRWAFILAVAVADVLGCSAQSRLLSELGSVYGVLIAVISMCSVMFILAITIFLRSSIAVG